MKLIKDKKKILAGIFLLVFLFSPHLADGFALDPAMTALQGLSEATGPVFAAIIASFFLFLIGSTALWISTSLLQGVIDITPEALTVLSGEAAPLVQIGWNFTTGIVNMLLVVAFVAIAISIIIGVDTFGLKKALPKLIMVAFLVNFTLLFVGMGIDITNFLFNSIGNQFSADEGNILWEAITPLFDLTNKLIHGILSLLAGYAVTLSIPYVGVAVQAAWLAVLIIFLPTMLQLTIYGIIALMMSGVFFLFFAILLARIFIIQILAILAPLAFFCLIFNETKKWWVMWLEHLVQWLFVGVIFIFLMYVGLALAPTVGSLFEVVTDDFPTWISFYTGDIISHIVLLIYFAVILGLCKKFIPAMAQAMIKQGHAAIKAASPFVGAVGGGGKKYLQHKMAESEGFQKTMKGFSTSGGGSRRLDHLAKRSLGKSLGTGSVRAQQEAVDRYKKEFKNASPEEKAQAIKEAKREVAPFGLGKGRGQGRDARGGAKEMGVLLAGGKDNREISNLLGDEDFDYEEIYEKAKLIGKEKDFAKANYMRHAEHMKHAENKNDETITNWIIENSKKPEEMQVLAKQLIEANRSGTFNEKQIEKEIVKGFMQYSKAGPWKSFVTEASGAEGIKLSEDVLKKIALSETGKEKTSDLTPEDLERTLNKIGPAVAAAIKKSPSEALFDFKKSSASGKSGKRDQSRDRMKDLRDNKEKEEGDNNPPSFGD